MPRKKSNAVENGEPSNKRQRVSKDEGASSEDSEPHVEAAAAASVSTKGSFAAVKDDLLREMSAAVKPKDRLKNFDFNQITIKGYTADQLRACYDRLRDNALRRIRRLPLQKEINFVREYALVSAIAEKGEKPKKPVSGYIRFVEEEKRKLQKKNPETSMPLKDIIPVIAGKWRSLSPEKKQRYQDAFEEEKKEYFIAHPELVKPPKKNASAAAKDDRPKTTVPKSKSAFELFCEAKKKHFSEKYDLKGVALTEKLAAKFAKLSERKREKWEGLAKESMDNYIQGLVNKKGSQQAKEAHGGSEKTTAPSSNAANNANYMDYLTGDQTDSSPQHSSKLAGKSPKKQAKNSWLE